MIRPHSLASCLVFVPLLVGLASAEDRKPGQQLEEVKEFRAPIDLTNPLARLTVATIAPQSWAPMGGNGRLYCLDGWGLMVVTQTQEVHKEIDDLLTVIRQARQEQEAAPDGNSLEIKSASISAARRRIGAELRTATSLSFNDATLADVAKTISDQHGISVVVDTQALEDAGLDPNLHVTRDLNGINLQDALWLLLSDLGLNYVIRDDAVHITSPQESESLITRVYKVGDLLR